MQEFHSDRTKNRNGVNPNTGAAGKLHLLEQKTPARYRAGVQRG